MTLRIAGLSSGEGDLLLSLHDKAERGVVDADIAVILSDRGAPVLDAAERADIDARRIEREGDKLEHEERIADAVRDADADLVALDGYMPILSDDFVDEFAGSVVSSHPSLLPSFNTTDPWSAALEAGVEITGATVHFVTDEIGEGPVLTQEPVRVRPDDDADSLRERVRHAEKAAYARAVRLYPDARVKDGRVVYDEDVFGEGRVESFGKAASLRYGENPHQDAAVYRDGGFGGASVVDAEEVGAGGKGMSFNNYNDADAALAAVREFDEPAAVVVKHTNPCGVATADEISEAYDRALATDEMSAFGGIVALNRRCDEETARSITDSFKEVVVAPSFTDEALDALHEKDSLRVLRTGGLDGERDGWTTKSLEGGLLVQERDDLRIGSDDLKVVTEREPTDEEVRGMLFGYTVVKHVKSNAIVLARENETVGVGAGQMSRVDAVRLACDKAEKEVEGSVLASDAFFPFRDNIDLAAENGVRAIIQPGGSKRDDEVIEACDEHGIAMAFTGARCFKH
ncbi:MAG: bifunctional phosphoribosylaminoimidazolecarboxamide formyltransferase/IMP cyclohydrolase [Halobacteriales archaeon]